MKLLLILTAIAAMCLTFGAYKYLKWQAIMWLASLFVVPSGVALLLDKKNEIFTAISRGNDLYAYGEQTSILDGGLLEFCILGLVLGGMLFMTALVKRYTVKSISAVVGDLKQHESMDQSSVIHRDLMAEIEKTDAAVGDATEQGKIDATQLGGPVPDKAATEPPPGHFEANTRARFMALGNSFITETVDRLKGVITEALNQLAQIKETVLRQSYKEIAEGHYNQTAQQVNDFAVGQIKKNYTATQIAKRTFLDTLKLSPAQQPDWEKRTARETLYMVGGFFMLVEFFVSWFFLRGALNEQEAMTLALIAVVIITILAIFTGFLFQHMRHNRPIFIRISASILYVSSWAMALIGFGLLMARRDLGTTAKDSTWENALHNMGDAYLSLFSDLTNLAVFLVNVIAIAFFYLKFLHWCEKFNGFDKVNNEAIQAEKSYTDLFERNAQDVSNAVQHANQKSNTNRSSAIQHCKEITDAASVLHNIKKIMENEYSKSLHPAYHSKINMYRKSNREHRVMAVNPSPTYFSEGSHMCEVEQHFANSGDIDQFLNGHQEKIDQSDNVREEIENKSMIWSSESADFGTNISRNFSAEIQSMDSSSQNTIGSKS